jgi:hypothetical protein
MPATAQTEEVIATFRPAHASELLEGVSVEYRGSWGRGFPRDGVITGGPHFDTDEPCWSVQLENGAQHWGYLDQFKIEVR